HDYGDLEQYPDIHAIHLIAEEIVDRVIVKAHPNDLVEDGGEYEKARKAEGEPIPPLLRVVKRALENVLKEILSQPETGEQEHSEQDIEDRHLDLHPHRIAGDEREKSERDGDAARDNGKHRKPPQHQPHGHNGDAGGDNQSPSAGGDAVHRVDDEHGHQGAELTQNIDCLFGVERILTP